MKILIVDDNPDNVRLVRDILSMRQYDLLAAANGQQALALAHTETPDLVLLDVNMPGMDGFEVCRQLKTDAKTAHIPVIMLTAMADVESRVTGLDAGADDYLPRPFSPKELLARVQRSLRSKSSADEMRLQQESLATTFKRYVAASVVEEMLRNPDQIKLGGKLRNITVLFADLEGFTSLSERTPPERLLQLLNVYHAFIVKIVTLYGGTVDKFIGDGVMVLYNTPIEQEDHTARAVKSALHIQDELHWFHEKLQADQRLTINFGIHTGMAIVGNVGTDELMDFTAVGDTVNVAARLQQTAHNGQILVSETVHQLVENFVFGRSRGQMRVRGRTETVTTYQISNTYFE